MTRSKISNGCATSEAVFSTAHMFDVHCGDARTLSERLPDESIDLTITSPPYSNMKDYGVPNQIGFGQDYKSYLNDLQKVFHEIFRATKRQGSLWIVIDSFRNNHEVIPLPFDLAAKLKATGWVLRDVIIWKKERTLPWAHKGATRKIFEYVMVFAKTGNIFRYYPDRQRDTSELKRWWVRYPERYNPKGKSLEEIWSYDIPTQGSWGKSYVQHFCPLPSELVSRIISLTTNPGDVVLDPFSGTGTVPAAASLLNRHYVGFELNHKYIRMFREHIKRASRNSSVQSSAIRQQTDIKSFEKTILELRILKFARLLLRALKNRLLSSKLRVFARQLRVRACQPHKLLVAEFVVYGVSSRLAKAEKSFLDKLCLKPPLSKFGIEQKIVFISELEALPRTYHTKKLYLYTISNSHQHSGACKWKDLNNVKHPLVSTIKAFVEEPDG